MYITIKQNNTHSKWRKNAMISLHICVIQMFGMTWQLTSLRTTGITPKAQSKIGLALTQCQRVVSSLMERFVGTAAGSSEIMDGIAPSRVRSGASALQRVSAFRAVEDVLCTSLLQNYPRDLSGREIALNEKSPPEIVLLQRNSLSSYRS